MGIYESLFGSSTDSRHAKHGRSLHSDKSFKSALKKFRLRVYGGSAGLNLSKAEADLIYKTVSPYFKRLPTGKKLSTSNKRNISYKFYKLYKAGDLSYEDYKDAKKILSQF